MATRFAKELPLAREQQGRVYRLSSQSWMAELGHRPAGDLWGIGARTAAKLAAHDLHTVADVARSDPREMAAWFGPTIGPGIKLLAMGGADVSITTEPAAAKSRSKQVTYPKGLTSADEIRGHVVALADDVSAEVFDLVSGEGRPATHVGVTVRTSTFFTRHKTAKLLAPTTDPAEIRRMALVVLDRFDVDRPVRLLGVRVVLADP